VPLTALKHAAEEHSVRAAEGERVMEAVVIFADVSGKAASTTTLSFFWQMRVGLKKLTKGPSSKATTEQAVRASSLFKLGFRIWSDSRPFWCMGF
jgi:hypothetical protein